MTETPEQRREKDRIRKAAKRAEERTRQGIIPVTYRIHKSNKARLDAIAKQMLTPSNEN